MTCAPAPASARATARPTPREAPVTNATRLSSFMVSPNIPCTIDDQGAIAPMKGASRPRGTEILAASRPTRFQFRRVMH
jgi:hypothetical protein